MAGRLILVPFTPERLEPETREWAEIHDATLVDVSTASDAYWRLLCSAWDASGPLVIVEHDMVPAPGVVERMLACDKAWCTSPYLVSATLLVRHGLGCVRFATELQLEIPNAMERAGQPIWDDGPVGLWSTIDGRLDHVLRSHGHQPHTHERSTHLH